MSTVIYQEEGTPPFQGAVDTLGDKVVWGSWTTYPTDTASVFSFRSKRSGLPDSLTNVAKSTSAGTNKNVTALRYVQQDGNIKPKVVIGWGDDSDHGLDQYSSSGTISSVWRSKLFSVGNTFQIREIRLPLGGAVAANMTITPKVLLDDLSSTVTLSAIDNTNYSGKRYVRYKSPALIACKGDNNFMLELDFSGIAVLPVTFPISIVIDVFTDEK
jgi:hypothetical protein